MKIEEARLYLEHTSKDDFNLEEHQKENRYQAIQVVLKEIDRLNNIINELEKELELERKSRQLLTDDLAKVCEISLKKENIINKAIEYLESYNTDFKNCRFGEAPISMRELGDLLDILKGDDKE